jgi:diacylglycerol kinase (ATP)
LQEYFRAWRGKPGSVINRSSNIASPRCTIRAAQKGGLAIHARNSEFQESPHKGKTGLRRVLNATHYSLAGLAAAARHEDAFRQELILVALLAPLALWVGDSAVERALLVGSLFMVLVVELLNSAVEATVDRISFEDHRLAKRAKDIGSAAVMLALANAGAIWVLIILS